MKQRTLNHCLSLVAATPLLQRYGFSRPKAMLQLAKAAKDPSHDLVVVEKNKRVEGFAWVICNGVFGRSAYLKLIIVAPDAQGRGVGRLLMRKVEKRHLKPNGLFLLATSTNRRARKFYEKLGYRKVGELPDFVKKGFKEVIYHRPAR